MHVQLDIEVTFEYPNTSKVNIEDHGHRNEPFDCGNGGSAQQGQYGPFGLLVLTDDAFQEQTAVFFYISQDINHSWVAHFCSDQSRWLLNYAVSISEVLVRLILFSAQTYYVCQRRSSLLPDLDTTVFWSDVRVLPTESFLSLRVLVGFLSSFICTAVNVIKC